jgi:hypothetical protein
MVNMHHKTTQYQQNAYNGQYSPGLIDNGTDSAKFKLATRLHSGNERASPSPSKVAALEGISFLHLPPALPLRKIMVAPCESWGE